MHCSTFLVFLCITMMADAHSGRSAVVVLSFGGVQSEFLQHYFRNLESLKTKCASPKHLLPVFPPKSSVNHWSIATGLYADGHGVIDDCKYDEPHKLCEYGQPNELITPVWIENENNEGTSGVMNWPGAERKYQNKSPTYYQGLTEGKPFEYHLNMMISWLMHETKPANLVMAYFDELDNVLHKNPALSDKAISVMNTIDNIVKTFIDKLAEYGIKERINLIILGTQGIKTAYYIQHIELDKIFRDNNISCPYIAMGSNAIVTPNGGEFDKVYGILKTATKSELSVDSKRYFVFKQNEIPESWHIKNLTLFKDKIFLVAGLNKYFWNDYLKETMNEQLLHRLIASKDDFKVGFDGYSNDEPCMRSFFIAMGPNFKPNKSVLPFETVDIYPLLRNLLGLKGKINKLQGNQRMKKTVEELLSTPPKNKDCIFRKIFSNLIKPIG